MDGCYSGIKKAAGGSSARLSFDHQRGMVGPTIYTWNYQVQKLKYIHTAQSVMKSGDAVAFREVDLDTLLCEKPAHGEVLVNVLHANELINWRASLLADRCIGAHPSNASGSEYFTGDYYFASFNEAVVDLKMGFFIVNGDQVWSDSAFATIQNGPADRSPAIRSEGDSRFFDDETANIEPLQVNGPVMMFCHWASLGNYGHWLLNSLLPAVLMLDEIKAKRITLITPPLPERWKNELLLIGVPEDQIIETEHQYVSVQHLIYPSTVSTQSNMLPSPFGLQVFDKLKEVLPPSGNGARHIFVSRLGTNGFRRMRNEEELVLHLENLGVHTVYPHELSLAEQIDAFSNAELIIGQFGAALWNMPFSPRGGLLIEISASIYGSFEYAALANLLDKEVILLTTEPTSADNAYAFEFDAMIDQVVGNARAFIEAGKQSDITPTHQG
ncbi:glycosyltransferase family 61 protein [Ensifer canadensis]